MQYAVTNKTRMGSGRLDNDAVIGSAVLPRDTVLSRRAWAMVWMCMLGTCCCSTAVVLINVGVFMKPLAEANGWSRGGIAMARPHDIGRRAPGVTTFALVNQAFG